jgi:predicted nuclease of predicted toxin-antitoxin system
MNKTAGEVRTNDVIIFGTGDLLQVPTVTADLDFVRAALAQGVAFDVILVQQGRLIGNRPPPP